MTAHISNNLVVVALGGNALGNDPETMKIKVRETATQIVKLKRSGKKVLICHGNGPQVGLIYNAFSESHRTDENIPDMPFPECGAMSQGYIGYSLVQAIKSELLSACDNAPVVSVITQTVVSRDDPAFQNPTKPIGNFLTQEEAEIQGSQTGDTYKEDAGRGYRRVVASPRPLDIVEMDAIKHLLDNDFIVVAGGGGGVPVLKTQMGYAGIPAVIDKDKTAALIASQLHADTFLILTAVPKVAINFNTENQKDLDEISTDQIKEYCVQGQFAPGSMLPKVEACLSYLENEPTGKAIIAELSKALNALNGESGTHIHA